MPGPNTLRPEDCSRPDSPALDAMKARIAAFLQNCPLPSRTLAAILCVLLGGCQVGYIARAAYEEGRLLWNRRPISEELSRADLDPELRAKLTTVLEVCRFARDQLGLNVGDAYRTVTIVDQRAIVWVVMAAPKDSLTPYQWWFPIVGSVPYRGYFDPTAAKAEAAEFEAAGYDSLVRPAVAFSSLGFFNDPLMSNALELDRVQLAGVIIHEPLPSHVLRAGRRDVR